MIVESEPKAFCGYDVYSRVLHGLQRLIYPASNIDIVSFFDTIVLIKPYLKKSDEA